MSVLLLLICEVTCPQYDIVIYSLALQNYASQAACVTDMVLFKSHQSVSNRFQFYDHWEFQPAAPVAAPADHLMKI